MVIELRHAQKAARLNASEAKRFYESSRLDLQGAVPLLAEQIVKMDCDRCKLKTEHYLLDYGGRPVLCRCLRCGQVKPNPGYPSESHEPYPADDRKPIYVV